jgi:anthranilate synthase component 1
MLPECHFEDFCTNFDNRQTQLVWEWIPADLNTPVSAYLKLKDRDTYSFLFESVEGGSVLGRYSAIGVKPDLVWTCSKDDNSSLEDLKNTLNDSKIDTKVEELPPMAASGLFGYMSYDMIRFIEDIPDNNIDEIEIPDSILIRPSIMIIFDNVRSMICLSTPVREHSGNTESPARDIYQQAKDRLQEIANRLASPLDLSGYSQKSELKLPLDVNLNFSRDEFCQIVDKAIEYIHAGDIFQVVPSIRMTTGYDLPAFELYRSLRRINPSPFMFFIDFRDFSLVGSSPEILVRVRNGQVTIRPIAGTRPRGKNAAEDSLLAQDLLEDPKERSEHLMLIDLARNDVSRIARTGSVEATELYAIEYYSHVMHIVSNIEGRLKDELDPLDALFAGFPAGTVSGAPKIRAMEIIDELEPVRRNFYGGCIGYLDGYGDVDSCIALRTALVKDNKLYIQAGAGIVADSVAESEFTECRNKAGALLKAAEDSVRSNQRQV